LLLPLVKDDEENNDADGDGDDEDDSFTRSPIPKDAARHHSLQDLKFEIIRSIEPVLVPVHPTNFQKFSTTVMELLSLCPLFFARRRSIFWKAIPQVSKGDRKNAVSSRDCVVLRIANKTMDRCCTSRRPSRGEAWNYGR